MAKPNFYNTDRYRITKTGNPPQDTVPYRPQRVSPLAQLQQHMLPSEVPTPFNDLVAGVPTEISREELLERGRPIATGEPTRILEAVFLADWLLVEAWDRTRGRWLPVKLSGEERQQQPPRQRRSGRTRIEADPDIRARYEKCEDYRRRTGATIAQTAAYLGERPSTYKRWRKRFRETGMA